MQLNAMGQFTAADIDQAFHGQGRKTARIIADIVDQSRDRMGVLIFAATVRHAKECLDSLPPGLSAMVTSMTSREDREEILRLAQEHASSAGKSLLELLGMRAFWRALWLSCCLLFVSKQVLACACLCLPASTYDYLWLPMVACDCLCPLIATDRHQLHPSSGEIWTSCCRPFWSVTTVRTCPSS
jgi:hypothetical protein